MSRIGKNPVALPQGVTLESKAGACLIKGQRGSLTVAFPETLTVEVADQTALVSRRSNHPRVRAIHGTIRQLISNAVHGVSTGFTRRLEVSGVGYRLAMKGKSLELEVGFSHPVKYDPPDGISLAIEDKVFIVVAGIDKQQVGQVASEIRGIKPPDPYKAKGIKYQGEVIQRKAGKVGA